MRLAATRWGLVLATWSSAACGSLDGPDAGAWPPGTVAFLGDGDEDGRIGLASASAAGVVWPEAIPEGAAALELRWTAGGATLVTRTDDALYAWDVAADERRDLGPIPFGEVSLHGPSPDGGHVARDVFTDAGGSRRRIGIVEVATGADLGAAIGCEIERFAWSTTPGQAFAVERHCAAGSDTVEERAVVRVADGTATTLETRPASIEIDVAPAPDGRWLAIVGDDGVELFALDGGDPVMLEDTPRTRLSPDWSADSAWLSYVDFGVGEVVVMRSDGSDRQTIGPASTFAEFDPLGDLLVVERPCGGGSELVGFDPETGADHDVATCTSLEEPMWAPDGSAIAFRSPCDEDTVRLVFASAEGASLGRSECERFGTMRWSPDSDGVTATWAEKNEPSLGVVVVRRDGAFHRLADGHEPRWRG